MSTETHHQHYYASAQMTSASPGLSIDEKNGDTVMKGDHIESDHLALGHSGENLTIDNNSSTSVMNDSNTDLSGQNAGRKRKQNEAFDSNESKDYRSPNRNKIYSINSHKRANYGNSESGFYRSRSTSSNSEPQVYFKLMLPASVAGGVIGRGGEKIAQIQRDAHVKMKMSKATDFYPNTNERICLIIGSVKAILKAHEFIVERMQEKERPEAMGGPGKLGDISEERVNQVKRCLIFVGFVFNSEKKKAISYQAQTQARAFIFYQKRIIRK